MHRRFVLPTCFLRRLLILSWLTLLPVFVQAQPKEYRAFWVDGWGAGFLSQSQVNSLLGVVGTSTGGTLRDANCNSVIVQVRRRYDTAYPSGIGEPYMSGLSPANFNALQAMLNAAHDTSNGKKRIEVHCWLVTFATAGGPVYNQHISPPTGSLTTFDNYWPTRDDSGLETDDKAFDPGHPLVLQYIVNACMDLVNNFDIDGVHYDYIRFTANNQGYNPTSIARYNQRYGLTGQPLPTNEQFKQWRRDQVTALVRQVYARIQKSKPWVRQSGSFVTWNPSPTTSTRAGFQATRPYYDVYSDWDSWMTEGIMDIAVPMTYYNWASLPNDYTRWINFEKDRHGKRHMIIGPGTYLNSLPDAIAEIAMTRTPSPAGNYAHGYSGYSYRVPYSGGTWAGFSSSLLSQINTNWADIPDMPWKTAPTNGHIMGTVTIGGTGAWADHATVNLTGPTSRSQYVDGTGFYAFIDLPPGNYTVTASKTGFPNSAANVNVALGAVTGNMYEQNFVLSTNGPPNISVPPQNLTVAQGSNATFNVSLNGTPPFSYQWRFGGADLDGATQSSYTRNNAQPPDAGDYSVVVTNSLGSVTSSVATLTVIVPPAIHPQPPSQSVTQGVNVTFTVAATGTAPLSYRWRWNGSPITGATQASYTRNNVQPGDAGNYSVVVSNFAAAVTSSNAVLTVWPAPVPPLILAEPTDLTVSAGQTALLAVTANGATPLAYQWQFNHANLAGATNSQLVLSNTQTNQAGGYSVTITNAFGATNSRLAALTVDQVFVAAGLNVLWSRPSLTVASLPNERGMAYNPATHRLILVSRTSPTMYVLDAETGADLWTMDTTGVTGGTSANYYLLLAGVADDGAVYAGNLTTAGTTTAFKLYRWANDNSTTVPTLVYSGDPGGGNQRWGDTMDVRGAGPNTQIIIASRSGNVVALFTTANGTTFTPQRITVADAPAGAFGLGVAFGAGNTFWGKATAQNLRQISFDPNSGTGTTIRNHGSPAIPSTIAPIGVSTMFNLLGGINVGATGNNFRLFDLTPTPPSFIAATNFPTDNDNTGTGTGAVDFHNDRVYALGPNNGILAMQIVPAPTPPGIMAHPEDQTRIAGQSAVFSVTASGTSPLTYQWHFNEAPISGATGSSYTRPALQPADAGDYSVTVTNSAGGTVSSNALLVVLEPPVISTDPQNRAVKVGTNVTFTVGALGTAPLRYQWQFNTADIAGATNSSFSLAAVQWGHAGDYAVTVTNLAGAAYSSPAVLTVLPADPSLIDAIALLSDGRVQFTGRGDVGDYTIEVSTNLVNWQDLVVVPNTNGSFLWLDSVTNAPERFYRARHE